MPADESILAFCKGCREQLPLIQARLMNDVHTPNNPEYSPWYKEGYCSLFCFENNKLAATPQLSGGSSHTGPVPIVNPRSEPDAHGALKWYRVTAALATQCEGRMWIVQAASPTAALDYVPDYVTFGRSAALESDHVVGVEPKRQVHKATQEHFPLIRISLPDGSVRQYKGWKDLNGPMRQDICGGLLSKDCASTLRSGAGEAISGALHVVARSLSLSLDSLYRPVWAHALRGLLVGAVIVAFLKVLDSMAAIFTVSPVAGCMMLVAFAGYFIPKIGHRTFPVIMLIAIFAGFEWGVAFAIYEAVAVAMIVGALLGLLPGMALGGLCGLIRARWLPRAPDAGAERALPIFTAILFPATGGAALICLYVFWANWFLHRF